ncbi:non-ribosomal peptide synthetase [uncultured Aquimarina sp.]|uniref:non-ribosomal peptide synthetase n=1 Tax=uncultured Aquimarina sp. TaxID=575652 RepID=UPI002623BFE7|nr:non-ribosomal peptide synthetase [uncultured Aquimarina sp.]
MKNTISNIQKYVWLDQIMTPESPKYNIGGYVIMNGDINFDLFNKAFKILVKENDIFSFVFKENKGVPIYDVPLHDHSEYLECFEESNKENAIKKIEEDFSEAFRFEEEKPLYKMWLINVSPDCSIWYSKLHHIIADGFSFQLLFNEVNRIYEKLLIEDGYTYADIENNTTLYENFILSEKAYRASDSFIEDKKFWMNKYQELPSLIYKESNRVEDHYHLETELSDIENQKLWELTRKERLSIFHVLLGVCSLVLAKYYRKSEISLGMPILNRKNAVQKKTFGPFISVLPLQLSLNKEDNFLSFIKGIKKELFSCYRHQGFQQADIIKESPNEINHLYDVRLSYERLQYNSDFAGNTSTIHPISNDSEDDPISIHIFEHEGGILKFRFDINEKYVPRLEANELIRSFKNVLVNLGQHINEHISEIQIADQKQISEVKEISRGTIVERIDETFLDLWDNSFKQKGEEIAVTYGTKNISYESLNTQTNIIAGYLQNKGLKKGDRIGVMLSRSEKSIACIIAILKIGAVYVPIDNNYPDERKQYIIDDSELTLILVDSFSNGTFDKKECNVDEVLEVEKYLEHDTETIEVLKEDLAYIIYTSGSTGTPKGVMISHGSLYDYIVTFVKYFELGSEDKVLQQASLSFDTSIEEIFPILSVGGNLIIANDTKDFNKLIKECEEFNITLLSTNPFVLQFLNENHEDYALSIKTLISGGDVLKQHHVHNLIKKYNVYNTYGPTESTVCATYHKIENSNSLMSIGKPITNRNVYILDNKNLLPKGAVGEIGLSGLGLAIAYLNQEDLTKKAFVNIQGERVYKTGDLGKWDDNDNLIFYGRKDNQLSYRGYRIETEEIEHAIQQVNVYVLDSYVCINEIKGMPIMIAYLVANESFVNISSLAIGLKEFLPEYMIPTHFVVIDAIPLLTNGKIDVKKLPSPKISDITETVQLPTTDEEKEIAAIWKELLKLDEVDVNVSFFELGGHSLLANQFISNLRDKKGIELSLKDFYKSPTIKEIGNLVPSLDKKEIEKIITPYQELYPLSYAQDRLWFLNQLDNEDNSYHVSRAIKLNGVINIPILEKTFTKLIEKHEILRTVFIDVDGEPYQKILSPYIYSIPVKNFSKVGEKRKEETINDSLKRIESTSFEIERGPLFRVELLKFSEEESVLIFCEHHLILDGWTQGILFRDFVDIYNELKKNPDFDVKQPDITFKDYAYWEKENLNEQVINEQLGFWENKFKDFSNDLSLPLDYDRPLTATTKGGTIEHMFSLEFSEKLRQFSEEQKVSLFITMITAFKIVLSKFSNHKDVCVGTAVANRHHKEFEEVLGMIVNTIPLRTVLDGNQSLVAVLNEVKKTCLDSYAYESTPFSKIVERLNPKRNLNHHPLFQHMFSFVNVPIKNMSLLDAEIEVVRGHNEFSKFDISVVVNTVFEQAGFFTSNLDRRISIEWEYNSDIFDTATMERMLSMYLNVLSELVTDSTQSLQSLNFISESEKNILLRDFNETSVDYTINKTVVTLFKEQVEKTPQSIALVCGGKELTYKKLDELSNQLAHYVLNNYDVSVEDLIAVKLERTEWLVISLLAVLKTGCAYVPIDSTYPKQRIDYIEEDSNCKVTIDENLLTEFNQQEDLVKTLPEIEIKPSNLAYVIYTSGSTGKPKGVMIEHKSLSNLCGWHISKYNLDTSSRGSLYAGIGFDASVWEIYPYLVSGGSLYPISNQEVRYDVNLLTEFLRDHKITHTYLPTKICEELVIQNIVLENTKILTGGEVLKLPENINNLRVYNNYGPSENTVVTTSFDLNKRIGESIPIGRPIGNTQIYIISESLELQPIGVVGEICISGEGLSRGYLNRPELTEEKFIKHPFTKGKRLYKTGDLGRWLPNGMIEFSGRKDDQIKIRGYRIELGEIENVILSQTKIKQVVVLAKEIAGSIVLAAYYVGNREVDKQELRAVIGEELPEYMVPNYFVALDELPLTSNGKIDKKALPEAVEEDIIKNKFVAAKTENEKQLVSIWQEVLELENIGVTDNFFELGGHSLKGTILVNKIKKSLGLEMSIKDLFLHPTIEGMLSNAIGSSYDSIPLIENQESYALTSSQRRLWVLSQFKEGNVAYNISGTTEIKGILDVDQLTKAFQYLISRHEILRTIFKRNDQDEVRQYIMDANTVEFSVDTFDLSNDTDQDTSIKTIIDKNYQYQFNLEKELLVKLGVIKISSNRHLLLFNMHHIISDGWSMEILNKELMLTYDSLVHNSDIQLPELSIQYKDYAEWLSSTEKQNKLNTSKKYWLEKFKGELPVLELPTDKKRPKIKTYNGDSAVHNFSVEMSEQLQLFSEQNGVSLFMVLMAGINGLLSRYTNSNDIIVGTPVAGRDHLDLENQIGLYLNTLAIRTQFDETICFKDLLNIQKDILLDGYSHQEYPLDLLVDDLDVKRDTSRSALFDILVILQNQQDLFTSVSPGVDELEIIPYKGEYRKVSQFDMSFVFSEIEGQLSLQLEYNTDIYDVDFVENLISHLDNFMANCMNNSHKSISEINYLNDAERQKLLYDFNATTVDSSNNTTIVDLFSTQALKTPDTVALVFDNKEFTYEEVNELSNQLAHFLISKYDIQEEDLIGVKLDRDEWLVVSLLAVLKTGGAYVPIDPDYPKQRIDYIEKDSNCKVTIDKELITLFKREDEIYKKLPDTKIKSSNLAYVIYTSGSTGAPKGVMLTHNNATTMLNWSEREFRTTKFDVMYAVTSHCFDLSVFEIFYPLSIGKKVRILSSGLTIGTHLNKDKNVLINTVPSVLQTLFDSQISFSNVVGINLAGEPFPISFTNKFLSTEIVVRNLYGPSEDTTYSSCQKIVKSYERSTPIGSPIDNTQFYILSNGLTLQPIGVIGELCISGDGLSKGYLNRPELTKEKFIDHPFINEKKLYKTGDLGRWLPDGTIEFIGRKDDQVKIRGYRIELGEIENVLVQQENIQQALVLVKEIQGDNVLVSYLIDSAEINKQELKSNLRTYLPDYMIPDYFQVLDSFPLTPNGKIDKKALPEVKGKDIFRNEYVAPSTKIEEQLVAIWEEVLIVNKIGVTDNFFELGGNSLKATVLINKINKTFNTLFSIQDLYEAQEIKRVSAKLKFINFQNQLELTNADNLEEITI